MRILQTCRWGSRYLPRAVKTYSQLWWGLWQRIEVAVALAQRYAVAYGDLQTPDAIAEITK